MPEPRTTLAAESAPSGGSCPDAVIVDPNERVEILRRPARLTLVTIIETERLTLRRIEAADAEFMLETLNEPAFIENVADRGVRTVADAVDYIAKKVTLSIEQFGFGFYLIELKNSRVPVGICGLIKRETLDDVDIGYSLLERFWGNGYACEAAAAVMNYGRTVVGLQRIVGLTAPTNKRSIKLLKKLGFRFERMIQLPDYTSESQLFVSS